MDKIRKKEEQKTFSVPDEILSEYKVFLSERNYAASNLLKQLHIRSKCSKTFASNYQIGQSYIQILLLLLRITRRKPTN